MPIIILFMKTNNTIEHFARLPFLWDTFESIFGADKEKQILYRSVFTEPCRLMDFGCATGNTTAAFLDFDYVGVDIDNVSIAWAKQKWQEYPNVTFIAADILGRKLKVKKFEAILFASTGHHLKNDQLPKILLKLSEYLMPGGKIYYFDTIKPDKRSHPITRWLCSIDRGTYMRGMKDFKILFNTISGKYRVKNISVKKVTGTFLPQPKYIFSLLYLKKK